MLSMISPAAKKCLAETVSLLDSLWREMEDELPVLAEIIKDPDSANDAAIRVMAKTCLMQCAVNRLNRQAVEA